MTAGQACMLVGFLLTVAAVGFWSVPAAMLTAGIVLFVAGGLEQRGRRSS